MVWASIFYLGVTIGLLVLFILIVVRTYSRKRKSQMESAKHRMLEDD